MGLGRVLAMAGVAAAGFAWFRRRRREPLADEYAEGRVTDRAVDALDDPVDQAIDESFPASDPPSYAGNPRSQSS